MNARIVTIIVGIIILALGLAGLLYPDRIMGVLGFSILNASQAAAALGEIRATYGGLFVVMGVYTLLAAMDPAAHRARLLFIGLMWLGACAGRLVGVSINGNPGLPGWAAVVFELLVGGALVAAVVLEPRTTAVTSAPMPRSPSPS
jgi:drug/metabolite transporter superfamily protein YnfA